MKGGGGVQVISMNVQPTAPTTSIKEDIVEQTSEQLQGDSFHSLLQKGKLEEELLQPEVPFNITDSLVNGNIVSLPFVDEVVTDMIPSEVENTEVDDQQSEVVTVVTSEQIEQLHTNGDELVLPDVSFIEEAMIDTPSLNEIQLITEQQIGPIIDSMKEVFSNLEQGENYKEVARQLLPILQHWMTLKREVSETELELQAEEQLTEEQWNIFKLLANNVEKRQHVAQQYGQDVSVTRHDITKWLQAAVERYSEDHHRPMISPTSLHQQAIPVSEVQQYTIHLQSLDRVERVSEELTQKLVHVIKESRFLTKTNHLQPFNQLTVVLRPEQLGNITVRFQQVDGNMTVQMIVTSQATKELLEANMHQLKHMFSPHQVVIERDETISDEEFFKGKSEEERQENGETFEQSHESEANRQDDDSENDFRSFMEQLAEGGLQNE